MFTFAKCIEMFIPRIRPYPARQFPDEIIQPMELIIEVFTEYVQNCLALYFGNAPSSKRLQHTE